MPTFNERLSQYAILSKMLHYSLPPMQDGERIQQLDDETAQMFRERLFDEHIGKILLFYGKGLIDRELLLTLTADRYPQLDDDLDAAGLCGKRTSIIRSRCQRQWQRNSLQTARQKPKRTERM